MKNILILIAFSVAIVSCKKIEGEGGTSTIIGSVTTNNINGAGELTATYAGADEDVFIIYGASEAGYDDKTTTSYDGTFKFAYLTPGDYTIFIYSDCDTCDSNEEVVLKTLTISENGEIVNAGELINND
ncbi:MAG: hypothetical protein AB8B72_09560 [Crocinitomicaceae bacterium]